LRRPVLVGHNVASTCASANEGGCHRHPVSPAGARHPAALGHRPSEIRNRTSWRALPNGWRERQSAANAAGDALVAGEVFSSWSACSPTKAYTRCASARGCEKTYFPASGTDRHGARHFIAKLAAVVTRKPVTARRKPVCARLCRRWPSSSRFDRDPRTRERAAAGIFTLRDLLHRVAAKDLDLDRMIMSVMSDSGL